MSLLFSLLVGLIFGLGLIVAGMADPAKVLGFLDLAGRWDPSLALVMAGAIALGLVAYRFGGRRAISLLGKPMRVPSVEHIDRKLVIGSALFGIGWGLAGICPGPSFVLLGIGGIAAAKGFAFVLAMLAGMALFEFCRRFDSERRKNI